MDHYGRLHVIVDDKKYIQDLVKIKWEKYNIYGMDYLLDHKSKHLLEQDFEIEEQYVLEIIKDISKIIKHHGIVIIDTITDDCDVSDTITYNFGDGIKQFVPEPQDFFYESDIGLLKEYVKQARLVLTTQEYETMNKFVI